MNYRMLIIDGNFLARSRFEAGGMAPGFLLTTFELQRDYSPWIIGIAWDRPGGDPYRRKLHPEYKQGRSKPQDFLEQVKAFKEVLPWFGFVQYTGESEGEGDDVIATICRTMPGPILIWTADKDMMQLIGPGVNMCKAGVAGQEDTLLTESNLVEKTGKDAKAWASFLTLAGDPGDKVPGISEVGKGRADSLLKACPDIVDLVLEGNGDEARRQVLANDVSQAKWIEKAIEERDLIELTRKLIELRTVPLETQESNRDADRAMQWLKDSGFEWLIEKMY